MRKSYMNFLKLFLALVTVFSIQVLNDNQQVSAISSPSYFLNSGGSGIEGDPYLISSTEEFLDYKYMIDIGKSVEGVYYKLVNDIDLESRLMESIGSYQYSFKGVFDGDNHKILNINIEDTNNHYNGLFCNSNGVIKNLEISSGNITGDGKLGAIVGNNNGIVDNCINNATLSSSLKVGGIVGINNGDILNCSNIGSIASPFTIGGIVAINNGNILNCSNSGSLVGNNYATGIAVENYGTIDNCSNSGSLSSPLKVSGIVGINNSDILNCSNSGALVGNSYAAGIAYENYGTIDNCENSGSITSESDGSGITISNKNIISNCINSGTVSSRALSAGIAIYNYAVGSIANSINSAKLISKFNSATGIVFTNWGNISNVINLGSVYSYNYPWSATAGLVLDNSGKLSNGFDLGGVNNDIEWLNDPDHYSAYYTNNGEVTNVYYLYDFNDRIDEDGSVVTNVKKLFTYNNDRMIVGDIHTITNNIPDLSSLATEAVFGEDFNIFIDEIIYDDQYLNLNTYSLKAINDGISDIKIKLTVERNDLVAGNGFTGEVITNSFEETFIQTIIQFPTITLDNDLGVKKYGDISEFNINTDGIIYIVSNNILIEDPEVLLDMSNSGILKKTIAKNDIVQFTKIGLDEGEYTAYLYADELFSEACDQKITIVSPFSNGDGNVDNPYWISDIEDLRKIDYSSLEHSETLYYIQKNDLDFSGIKTWDPINAEDINFDGNYHVITNMSLISTDFDDQALFSSVEESEIKRIGIVDATINGGELSAILCEESSSSTFEEVFVSGSIIADFVSGGITAVSYETTYINCFSKVDITGGHYIGGIVGALSEADINNSYSASTIIVVESNERRSREASIGGLVGLMIDDSIINNSNYYDNDLFIDDSESTFGISSLNMKKEGTFKMVDGTSWDFEDVWSIHDSVNGGYPYLKNFKYFSDQYVSDEESTSNNEVIVNPVVVEKPQPKTNASKKSLEKTIELIGIPDGELNKKITVSASEDAFDTSVEVVIKSDEDTRKQIEEKIGDLDNLNILPMDITVYQKGTSNKLQPASGTTVSIRYPIPEDMLEDMENIQVVCINGDLLEYLDSTIVEIDGVYYIEFEAEHFSPYALVLSKSTDQVVEETTVETVDNNEVIVEDEIVKDYSNYIIGLVIVIIAGAVIVIKNKKK